MAASFSEQMRRSTYDGLRGLKDLGRVKDNSGKQCLSLHPGAV
jgi:hypothetical protein